MIYREGRIRWERMRLPFHSAQEKRKKKHQKNPPPPTKPSPKELAILFKRRRREDPYHACVGWETRALSHARRVSTCLRQCRPGETGAGACPPPPLARSRSFRSTPAVGPNGPPEQAFVFRSGGPKPTRPERMRMPRCISTRDRTRPPLPPLETCSSKAVPAVHRAVCQRGYPMRCDCVSPILVQEDAPTEAYPTYVP